MAGLSAQEAFPFMHLLTGLPQKCSMLRSLSNDAAS